MSYVGRILPLDDPCCDFRFCVAKRCYRDGGAPLRERAKKARATDVVAVELAVAAAIWWLAFAITFRPGRTLALSTCGSHRPLLPPTAVRPPSDPAQGCITKEYMDKLQRALEAGTPGRERIEEAMREEPAATSLKG